jgi:deoxyribodipyrimidine photo-lyase
LERKSKDADWSVVWFRLDLRLADNPALNAALEKGGAVIPLYVWAPEEEAGWAMGSASRWWLHHSLKALDRELRKKGSRLTIRRGPTLSVLREVLRATGARALFWNRRYEPAMLTRDREIVEALGADGVEVRSFNGGLLHEPEIVRNQSGKPFKVFTPFWRHCLQRLDPGKPRAAPKHLPAPRRWPGSLSVETLELEPKIQWYQGLAAAWTPGSKAGAMRLRDFVRAQLAAYTTQRNRPDLQGTSRLSPHLHFGEVSAAEVWHAVRCQAQYAGMGSTWQNSQFITELGWREFAHHLLFHFPKTPQEPLRPEFVRFPWRRSKGWLTCWQRGMTGYPIVDAGMRQLWATGWMHNRVRMIAGSFLVKDLLISWEEGARWFWDTLVDADLANNTLGWQWVAGCGADAAPFFRIFNPTIQGQKFDPQGSYVRAWCPELARLSDRWIHEPTKAPMDVLQKAGIELGKDYPHPVVCHAIAREVALERFEKSLKKYPRLILPS